MKDALTDRVAKFSLGKVEVDGMSAKQLYDTPTQIGEKVNSRSLTYNSCQRCVFNQCVYVKT
jgi:hypothetical protein